MGGAAGAQQGEGWPAALGCLGQQLLSGLQQSSGRQRLLLLGAAPLLRPLPLCATAAVAATVGSPCGQSTYGVAAWTCRPQQERCCLDMLPPTGVTIKKCRYLESSGCVGMCTNMCKLPTQRFFTDTFGTPCPLPDPPGSLAACGSALMCMLAQGRPRTPPACRMLRPFPSLLPSLLRRPAPDHEPQLRRPVSGRGGPQEGGGRGQAGACAAPEACLGAGAPLR